MKIKLYTTFIIVLNALVVYSEVPYQIIAFTLISLFFAWFLTYKKLRAFIKVGLLLCSFIVLRVLFEKLISTECAVSFLLILASLKSWELDTESDHFNMFLILVLTECSLFLLNSSFLVFIFGLLKMIFFFYYIIKIRNYEISNLSFKRIFVIVFPALIFAILLFFTFPRFTQGFINTGELQSAYSGTSTQFNFRELTALNPSTTQVFKVFGLEKENLNPTLLYWRSHLLWENKNQDWKSGYHNLKSEPLDVPVSQYRYRVELLEKVKEFLPTLDGRNRVYSPLSTNSYLDGSHRLKQPLRGELIYDVQGNYGDTQIFYNDLMKRKGLKLNSTRADEVRSKFFPNIDLTLDEASRLKILVKKFKEREFQYSLNPPLYNSVEDFIMSGREGYCTHFSAAFAFLARTINLPSRIVVGYLGGEKNPFDGSLIVREQDAHAWVEIYLAERGWVRVDPTGLVVPSRLLMNAGEFFQQLNPFLEIFNLKIDRSLFTFDIVKNISLYIDSLNSKFSTNVFSFDRDAQADLLRRINLLNIKPGWFFSFTVVSFLIFFYALFWLFDRNKLHSAEKKYLRFLKKMQKMGIEKNPSETALQFKQRCLESFPKRSIEIHRETDSYLEHIYGNKSLRDAIEE